MGNVLVPIPEVVVPGRRLGRNVNHDPRSVAFRVGARAVTPKSVRWERHGPILDQGNLGSCVANAGTAMLMCDPFWSTLDKQLQKVLSDAQTAEQYAVQTYREVTRIDPFPGSWEPDDTGSDGLSLGKLFKSRGLAAGYEHVMSLDDAHAAIQKGPYPVGVSWLSNMDQPSSEGIVNVSGSSRGGHEILVTEYDASRDLWWLDNSWSEAFGKNGRFAISSEGYQKLMKLQADGTPMTPSSQPAPEPKPVADVPVNFTADQFHTLDKWAGKVRSWWPVYGRAASKAWVAATR